MDGPRGTVVLAVLLVISGYLGFIAGHVSGFPLFGLMGVAGFAFAIAVLVGEAIAQFRAGLAEPRDEEPRRTPHASALDPEVPPRRRRSAED